MKEKRRNFKLIYDIYQKENMFCHFIYGLNIDQINFKKRYESHVQST